MTEVGPSVGRRGFFGVLGGTALAAGGAGFGIARATTTSPSATEPGTTAPDVSTQTVPFHGVHQAGLDIAPQAYSAVAAYDVHDDIDQQRLAAALGILTDDLERITQGSPALGDTAPMLAQNPARLTVMVGLGPALLQRYGIAGPVGFVPLPPFEQIDQLDPAYCDGDLVLVIAADDALTVAHTLRMLTKDLRGFMTTRWVQRGFHDVASANASGQTPRNLFGQKDGTVNPQPDTSDFDASVWIDDGVWAGGTTLVVRRIRMDMDDWDALDPAAMEQVIGRRLHSGAPLTGTDEFDEPDFAATDAFGLPVIRDTAHIRLSRAESADQQMLRRPYSYDDSTAGQTDMGLIFLAYQADIDQQFIPVQQRLAEADMLNEWTIPIGSAVFAMLPGCEDGHDLGEGIIS